MDTLSSDSVDGGADPQPVSSGLDLKVVFASVDAIPLEAARHPSTPIGTGATVRIGRGGTGHETGEDTMEDRLPAFVRAWLYSGVADVAESSEVELLGEVVSRDMVCLDDSDGEGNIRQTRAGHVRDRPARTDQRLRRWKNAEQQRGR